MFPHERDLKIAVIGLGYVGLPLSIEFGKRYSAVFGYDINVNRVNQLINGRDVTNEVVDDELSELRGVKFTHDLTDIAHCNFYIVSVPTPINSDKTPNLEPLKESSEMIGSVLSKNDVVVFESTVYPGATEEVCLPVLEIASGLTVNQDFFLGYSPERINPGDKKHKLTDIVKVTSGSTPEAAEFIDSVYKSVVVAGTHLADSIKIAEAAKVIENTQRDLNIAFVNELSIIFELMGIDTMKVLDAASTKWNFLSFRPGLVGGHCIGVDPYYLTYKAQALGYHPEIILAGRRLNDLMGSLVANKFMKEMVKKDIHINGARVLIMGLTFKENCPDTRNTKVADLIKELSLFGLKIDVWDPFVNELPGELIGMSNLVVEPTKQVYDGIILAVAHNQFADLSPDWFSKIGNQANVLFDLKALLDEKIVDFRL